MVNELQLAKRTYNLLAHIFLSWKTYRTSLDFFLRLRDSSHMDKDLETKMYAYK